MNNREIKEWPEWEMAELIGIGGWSRVYRAVNRNHPDQQAAVKVMPVRNEEVEKVLHGIQRMKQLKGMPNIVSIEDYAIRQDGADTSTVLIRMELLRPLRSYLSDKVLSETEILRMGIDLCKGLEQCHQHGIVHGDIKPDNILVRDMSEHGILFKLGDFGASEAEETEPGDEEEGEDLQIEGTPEYMAPEQLEGKMDARTDIYALGVTLYRYLNGDKLPFLPESVRLPSNEDRVAALKMRLSGITLPPLADVSEKTMAVLWKACAFRPEDRYQDAEAFRMALEEALQDAEEGKEENNPEEAVSGERRTKQTRNAGHLKSILWVSLAVLMFVVGIAVWNKNRVKWNQPHIVPERTAIPMQKVEIVDRDEDTEPVRDGLVRLKEAWDQMDHHVLPSSLTEIPFILEAQQYAPELQIAFCEEDSSLCVRKPNDCENWGAILVMPDKNCIVTKYNPEGKSWIFPVQPGWEKGWVLFAQNARKTTVEYYISCENSRLDEISFSISKGSSMLTFTAHMDNAGQSDKVWNVTMVTPEGEWLSGTYGVGGSRVLE
ncbi:MAG: serine/threonine protein kinase [Clostridiales bacterium]|nr:serine/threonine protein kinase [Clostridiales bacterium]